MNNYFMYSKRAIITSSTINATSNLFLGWGVFWYTVWATLPPKAWVAWEKTRYVYIDKITGKLLGVRE